MKRWLIFALTTVLGFATLFAIDAYYRDRVRQENIQQLTARLEITKKDLEEGIDHRILVVENLRAFILASSTMPERETFNRYAAIVLSHSPEVRALQYVDTGHIIRYIYPLEENEAALNLDLMTRPAAPFVEKAIQTRTTTVNDPTITAQNSLSIVIRSPIYDGDRYLGLAQGVVDITSLLEEASQTLNPQFNILLKDANGNIFWEAESLAGNPRSSTVQVGDNSWELTLGWVPPEPEPEPYILGLIWGLGGAFLISLLFTINQTFRHVTGLSVAVEEKAAALAKSEKLYRTLVETADDVILLTDLEGRHLFQNSAYYTSLGFEEGEDVELEGYARVHPEDEPILREKMSELLATGVMTTEYRVRHKEGHWVHYYARSKLIQDEQGNPQSILTIIRDITERKQAEEALRQSEASLRESQRVAHVGHWVWNTQKNQVVWSDEMKRIFGLDPIHFAGDLNKIIEQAIHPEDREKVAKANSAVLAEQKSAPMEYRIVLPDQSVRIIWAVPGNQIVNESGKILKLTGIVQDITERKQLEEESRLKDELLHITGEMAKVGGWEFDAQTLKGTWTDEVARIHDLDPDQKTNVELGLSFYLPPSREKIDRAIKEAIELAKPYDLELEMVSAKGTRKWVRTMGLPITDGGKVIKVRGIFQDITARKRQDQELLETKNLLEKTFASLNEAVLIVDPADRTIVYCNPAVERIFGYAVDELMGKNTAILHVDQEAYDRFGQIGEPILEEKGIFQTEYKMRRSDGQTIITENTVTTLIDEAGWTNGVVSVIRDITERKQLEKERITLEKQFHQAQKMEAVGQLTAGIAHDFNNLIMAINGNAELMQMQIDPDDPLYKMTDTILRAGSRAANLIRQLLIFSRKQIMAPQIVELNTVITELNRMLNRIIGENIEVKLNLATDLWPVKVDSTQIEQVAVNLVVNARDAMPEGGKLILETANVELDEVYSAGHMEVQPGKYVLLTISDTGIGMSREVQERLFEPFFTTKEVGKGTGLGLATVYGIVKQSDGYIWVYSEEGQGSTFKVYLPRTTEVDTPSAAAPAPKEVRAGQETILVVEDERAIRKLAKSILQKQGYTVLAAEDSQQALQIADLHTGPIHLLLTDVVMPGMSGKALAEELTQRYPQLKVVFMSGYADEVISHHGVLEPGVVLLQKPFSFMEMARKVREMLG